MFIFILRYITYVISDASALEEQVQFLTLQLGPEVLRSHALIVPFLVAIRAVAGRLTIGLGGSVLVGAF